MADIAKLALVVDSGSVKGATAELYKFSKESSNVESQTKKTKKATDGLLDSMKNYASLAVVSVAVWRVIDAHREFQKSISELSAITGATGADLEFYRQQALALGSSTTFAASEVAAAFKLVASAKPDLLESKEALAAVTREVLTLAEAAGIDLPAAANAVGGALNQFGADASLAGDYVNVLAAGAKLGSSEITQTAEALKNAGTVAASVGLSFEQTNAAIQALASVSIKGAEAGTGLRGVLLKLSTQNNDEFNPQIVGLTAALNNLRDAELSTIQMSEIFGQESITAATALINQANEVDRLTGALAGTDIAYQQAAINTNNLDGDVKAMSSSWSGAALVIGQTFDPILRALTQAITWLGKVVQTTAIEFDDLADTLASYAAIAVSLISLDYQQIETITELRREARAATEEKIANVWAEAGEKKKAIEEEEKAEQSRATAEAGRVAIREKAIEDAAKRRAETAAKEEEQLAIRTAKQEEREAMEVERERMRLENKFVALQEGFLTEMEIIAIQQEEKQLFLEDALMQEIITYEQHEEYKTLVEEQGIAARAKLGEAERKGKLKLVSGTLNNVSALMNSGNKQMFEIGKKAALAQAAISGAQAIMDAWRAGMATSGPWAPFIAAAYAASAAITAANNINNIKSQTFSGGGSMSAPSGGGATASAGGGAPVTAQEAPARPQQDLTIRREGGGIWTDDMVESLLVKVGDYSRDNDIGLGNVRFA
jgi:TP901 family phage tail tape measure protein